MLSLEEEFINNISDEGVRGRVRSQLHYEVLGEISQAITHDGSVGCGVSIYLRPPKGRWENIKGSLKNFYKDKSLFVL